MRELSKGTLFDIYHKVYACSKQCTSMEGMLLSYCLYTNGAKGLEVAMKKNAVLTYPIKHRKTYDVLSLLKANGYKDVKICAVPFHYQKKFPLIQHRPEMNFQIPDLRELCMNFGYQCEIGELETFNIERERIYRIRRCFCGKIKSAFN